MLFTYNTPRTFHFRFDPTAGAFLASKLPQSDFYAQVDLDGVNQYGAYVGSSQKTMGVNTWTVVNLHIQFYQYIAAEGKNVTFDLEYKKVAVWRESATSWIISTDGRFTFGDFIPSADAELSSIRRRSVNHHGKVNMPIELRVTLDPQ